MARDTIKDGPNFYRMFREGQLDYTNSTHKAWMDEYYNQLVNAPDLEIFARSPAYAHLPPVQHAHDVRPGGHNYLVPPFRYGRYLQLFKNGQLIWKEPHMKEILDAYYMNFKDTPDFQYFLNLYRPYFRVPPQDLLPKAVEAPVMPPEASKVEEVAQVTPEVVEAAVEPVEAPKKKSKKTKEVKEALPPTPDVQ